MKLYTVLIGGLEHTLQLDEDEAKRYGADATEVKAGTAANKARPAVKNKES